MFGSLFYILACLSLSGTASLHGPRSRRIVRGFEADIKSFPYAVFLYFNVNRPSSCGASLITMSSIVTSAHCMQELSTENGKIHAFLGASIPMYSKVVRNITDFKIHPKYDANRGKYDLSVATFNRAVPTMDGIQKIPIYKKNIQANDHFYTAGWGKKWPSVVPDYSNARTLEASKQRVVLNSECFNKSGIKRTLIFLCSYPIKGYHYRGDLGNGLVLLKPFLALVGVVSFIVKDATLYANLMIQRKWVRESIIALNDDEAHGFDCC